MGIAHCQLFKYLNLRSGVIFLLQQLQHLYVPYPLSLLSSLHLLINSIACSAPMNGETCQTQILSIEDNGTPSKIDIYNLNTVGSTSMYNRNGISIANYADNVNVFPDNIALVIESEFEF